MKRYLLFSGSNFYPIGGWNDFQTSFDTIEEAEKHAVTLREWCQHDWHHIVDSETQERVT